MYTLYIFASFLCEGSKSCLVYSGMVKQTKQYGNSHNSLLTIKVLKFDLAKSTIKTE